MIRVGEKRERQESISRCNDRKTAKVLWVPESGGDGDDPAAKAVGAVDGARDDASSTGVADTGAADMQGDQYPLAARVPPSGDLAAMRPESERTCGICKQSFDSRNAMMIHVRACHPTGHGVRSGRGARARREAKREAKRSAPPALLPPQSPSPPDSECNAVQVVMLGEAEAAGVRDEPPEVGGEATANKAAMETDGGEAEASSLEAEPTSPPPEADPPREQEKPRAAPRPYKKLHDCGFCGILCHGRTDLFRHLREAHACGWIGAVRKGTRGRRFKPSSGGSRGNFIPRLRRSKQHRGAAAAALRRTAKLAKVGGWGDWDPADNPARSHGFTSRAEYEAAGEAVRRERRATERATRTRQQRASSRHRRAEVAGLRRGEGVRKARWNAAKRAAADRPSRAAARPEAYKARRREDADVRRTAAYANDVDALRAGADDVDALLEGVCDVDALPAG